jgi:hypothetical protein
MANRLLRSIAVKIGAGLATGFTLSLASRRPRRPTPNLAPLLTRIEDIESRVTRVELTGSAVVAPAPEEIEALGTLVSSQSEDIASLRDEIRRIERHNVEQVEAFGQKVALVEQQVPAHIETSVNARMAELEQRLRGEFQEIHHRTVDAFVETIEHRVVGRIAALENSLAEQSQSIVSLREKSLQTDDNLQRLLEAVEKLCTRVEAQAQIALLSRPSRLPEAQPPAAPEASAETRVQESFASHYQRALAREAEVKAAPEPESAFANTARSAHPQRRDMKSVGVAALLGLAILGFRLIR